MSNLIKYSTTAQTQALKTGDYWIGTGDVLKGSTSTSGFWNGISPPTSGYTIYLNKASQGPSIYVPTSDSQLMDYTNKIGSQSFTSVTQCFNWYNTQSDKMVFNKDYPAIITSGLVLNLDATFRPSYSTSGTTWYDLSPSGNNGTLINGPVYSSSFGGIITCDGTDDYIQVGDSSSLDFGTSNFTVEYWFRKLTTTTGFDNIWGPNKWNTGASPGTNEWTLGIGNGSTGTGNNYAFAVEVGNTIYGTGESSEQLSLNTWYQLIGIRNGDTLSTYLNGVLKQNVSPAGFSASSSINNVGRNLRINNSAVNSLYTNADNYIVRVYNRALSSTEILQNFYGSNIVTSGLVLYLDAGNIVSYPQTGTAWYDISSGGNNGTLTNGPTFDSANGGSIVLDGTDDYVGIANSTSLQLSTGMSVCCWVKITNSTDELADILNKQTYNSGLDNSGYILRYFNGSSGIFGRLDFIILNNSYNVVNTNTNVVLLNTWYYLCGVYNGSQMIIYVNGVSSGTINYSSNARTNNVSLLLGGYSFGGYSIGGNVSIVQIYNRGLTGTEILQNYNAQKSRFGL